MANKTGLPIPACQSFVCNVTLEATDLEQLEANAQASLGDWHTKVVANSPQRDVIVGYIGSWWEHQEGYGGPTPKQHEYMPSGKMADFYVNQRDTSIYGTTSNPAMIQFKDFSFEVNAWETEFNLLMEVYRRQYEEVLNVAAGPTYQVEEWQESNYSETISATTSWTMNQKIRVEYHDGVSPFPLVLVDQVNNITDIPLNTRLSAEGGNIYQNVANDLLALGYTPPAPGTTRTDFIRVMVINMKGSVARVADPDTYFVTGNSPKLPTDYAGVQYVKFSMSKPNC